MDAQDFVNLFRNEEFQKLLATYRKAAEPLDYIDSLPPIKIAHYNGPGIHIKTHSNLEVWLWKSKRL